MQRKKPFEVNPFLNAIPGVQSKVELVAKCPGCGLKMVVQVTPLQISYNVSINSDPEEIARVLLKQKKSFGS